MWVGGGERMKTGEKVKCVWFCCWCNESDKIVVRCYGCFTFLHLVPVTVATVHSLMMRLVMVMMLLCVLWLWHWQLLHRVVFYNDGNGGFTKVLRFTFDALLCLIYKSKKPTLPPQSSPTWPIHHHFFWFVPRSSCSCSSSWVHFSYRVFDDLFVCSLSGTKFIHTTIYRPCVQLTVIETLLHPATQPEPTPVNYFNKWSKTANVKYGLFTFEFSGKCQKQHYLI